MSSFLQGKESTENGSPSLGKNSENGLQNNKDVEHKNMLPQENDKISPNAKDKTVEKTDELDHDKIMNSDREINEKNQDEFSVVKTNNLDNGETEMVKDKKELSIDS